MSEQADKRRCEWPGCEEAATRRAERVTSLGVGADAEGRPEVRHQETRGDLCDRHYEEFRGRGGVTEMPFGPWRTE